MFVMLYAYECMCKMYVSKINIWVVYLYYLIYLGKIKNSFFIIVSLHRMQFVMFGLKNQA